MSRPLNVPSSGSVKLIELITQYNEITDEENKADLKRLFYLQKINHLSKYSADNAIIQWRNQLEEDGLEFHLQHYGIHRDSSQLVQSIEFANAVCPLVSKASLPNSSKADFYEAMQERDKLFSGDASVENIGTYIEYNQTIMAYYAQNLQLQEKVQKSLYSLRLVYAKADAIQGFVQHEFAEYQTNVLGNPKGNNKNFRFTINGKGTPDETVIRVEDRNSVGKEQVLQAHPVSEYFSEDYIMLMVPFLNEEGTEAYQPVVVSEFVSQGDLAHYAERLKGENPTEITKKTLDFMDKLSDFCIQLMDSGHYHPDIKLSNFLTDGERLIVSDRKTFTNKKEPRPLEIKSSPAYAAPEYRKCIKKDFSGLSNDRDTRNKLDMPSYMSYQVGMAFKEFMLKSGLISFGKVNEQQYIHDFEKWQSLSTFATAQTNEVKNMSVLVQELTRWKPQDRLSIGHFHRLLEKTALSPEQFLVELEILSPTNQLSSFKDIELIKTALNAEHISKEQLKKIEVLTDLEQLFQESIGEPRANLKDANVNLHSLLNNKLKDHVVPYLNLIDPQAIETSLLENDLKKATTWEWILHKLRIHSVPRISTLNDINDKLPQMDKMTEMCLLLSGKSGIQTFPSMDSNKKGMFQKLKDMISTAKREPEPTEFESSAHIVSKLTSSSSSSMSIVDENSESSVQMHDTGNEPVDDLDELPAPKVTVPSPKIGGIFSTIERGNKGKNTVETEVSHPELGSS